MLRLCPLTKIRCEPADVVDVAGVVGVEVGVVGVGVVVGVVGVGVVGVVGGVGVGVVGVVVGGGAGVVVGVVVGVLGSAAEGCGSSFRPSSSGVRLATVGAHAANDSATPRAAEHAQRERCSDMKAV